MLRRDFIISLAGMAALAALPGCSLQRPLAIGIHPWPGYEPMYLAEHFGWMPSGVQLHTAQSATASLEGLRSGRLDGAALTLDEVLRARATGVPLIIVLVLNESVGADVVLAREDIDGPAGLRGKRIAVEQSTVGGVVLRKLLEAGGLSTEEVTVLDIPNEDLLTAWNAGMTDAVVTFSPIDLLIERNGGRRIFDSRQFPGTIFDVLAMRSDRLAWRSGLVRELISAHLRGIEHIRTSKDDAMRRIASWRGLSLPEVQLSFGGIALPDLNQNRRMLDPGGDLMQAADELMQMLSRSELGTGLDDLVTDSYLPASERPS